MYAKRMYSEKGRLSTVDAWANQYNIICLSPSMLVVVFYLFIFLLFVLQKAEKVQKERSLEQLKSH